MSTDPLDGRGGDERGADGRGSGGRRRSTHAHTAILDATLDLLTEVGYTRLTVEGIAARAGVAKTTIYRWWSTKSALAVEAIRAGSAPSPPVRPTGDLRADVRAAVQANLDCYTRSAVGTALPGVVADLVQDGSAAELLEGLLHPHREALDRIVRDAVDRGELTPGTDAGPLHEIVAGTLLYRVLRGERPSGADTEKLVGIILTCLTVSARP